MVQRRCRRFGGVVRGGRGWRQLVPVTQASGRTRWLWGQPDTDKVWHRVPPDKTLRANNFSQMSSGRHE
ncbi:hypothetical protein GCM10010359_45680 [Streptomyces morookaense]|nr:hypothetical protein GCM10010359_45680 [Streptomyces morookaense]